MLPSRKLAAAVTVCALALTGLSGAALGSATAAIPDKGPALLDTHLTAASFADPGATDQVWVRWTLSPDVSNSQLRDELVGMKEANISGAEIGQGYYPSTSQLRVIYEKANQLGITISLSHGPVANPNGFSINDDQARKKLVYGMAVVNGGDSFTGAIPAATPAVTNRTTILKVLAYKCVGTCSTTVTSSLDQSSVIDLTSQLTGTNSLGIQGGSTAGSLAWTAPAGSQWALLSFYSTGNLAQPDLLTEEGTKVLTDDMDAEFAPIKDLLIENGGDLFYDSHSSDRGSPTDTWSNTMSADFKEEKGYAIEPYLPLLVNRAASGFGAAPLAFTFTDASTTAKVRNDFYDARTTLWIDNQVLPLQKWADTYNQLIRIQPYGENGSAVDAITGAAYSDKTENETLWAGDEVDQYLPEASANHMTGRNWYSIEGSAALNNAYAMTWQDQVVHMNKAFAGGITKLIYHIYPSESGAASKWPGYSLFPNSFGDSWGPRSPMWVDAANVNDYFARSQQLLSQGDAKVDVAVYMQNYIYPQPYSMNNLQFWSDPTLERSGFTRDYLNPTLLDLPNAVVSNGVLAEDGPSYKAFIFDSTQLPATAPSASTVTVDVARKMLAFARAGLPVVIVGTAPVGAPGLDATADAKVQGLISQLLANENTHVVANEAAVPALLADLEITPAAQPVEEGPVLTVHRQDADTDFYWFYNQGSVISAGEPATNFESGVGSPISTEFTLTGDGVPYLLDPWNGEITPILEYTREGDTVTVPIDLDREDTAIIALTTEPERFDSEDAAVHVVSTTADELVTSGGRVFIRDSEAGTYATTLSDGHVVHTTIGASPAAVDLTDVDWNLSAQTWAPASTYGTTGTAGAATAVSTVEVALEGLTAWPDIPALTDASGIGTYSTTFDLPSDYSGSVGTVLDLGEVMDSFTLEINGEEVPFVNQLRASVDVGSYLKAGENDITVRVATTLRNKLRTLDTTIGTRPKQQYGLIGPVTLTSLAQGEVALSGEAPSVTTQPTAEVLTNAGATVTLTAAADSDSPITTSWQQSTDGGTTWTTVPNATTGTLSVTAAVSGIRYRAVFSNDWGTTTSHETRVLLRGAPVVTTQPASTISKVTGSAGTPITLSSAASGTPTPSIQWQKSTDKGKTWKNVAGATASNLTVTLKPSAVTPKFRAKFSNDSGAVYSSVSTVSVKLKTTASVSLSSKVRKGKAGTASVSVAPRADNPTGSVVVHVGSKKFTKQLKASADGHVTIKLSRLKKGSYKVWVEYKATSNSKFASSTSKVTTVKVS